MRNTDMGPAPARRPFWRLGAIGVAALALAAPSASAADEGLDLWNDPTFQRQFLGSFGVQAEIEPRVTVVEREMLEKIVPLLASDLEAAARELEKITRPAASATFDFTLGNIRFQQDRLDDAALHFQAALEKFPSFRRAHKNLGLIRVRRGRFEEAARSLTRVVELGGGDGLTLGLLGYAYASTGSYVSAESAYRNAVLLRPDTLDWRLGLAQSLFKQQKHGEAVSLCDELIRRHPERADFWLLQANAFIGLGQPLRAAENFEVVRRLGKATPASLQTLGDIYVNEALWDLAAGAYQAALQGEAGRDPQRALRCIETLAQRGALEQAKALLAGLDAWGGERLAEPERKRALKVRARIAAGEGEGEQAAGVLEEIVSIDPLDGEALILLGQHYARAREPERAVFYYERAESLQDFEAEARVRHAQVLVEQARYREAVPLLKRAQELKPRDEVARYLEQVERVARAQR